MRQVISILAMALLATSLLTAQAEARGGGGGGHAGGMGGGFGGGAHIGGLGGVGPVGGLGGVHIGGGVGHVGGLGGTRIGAVGAGGDIGTGVHPGAVGSNTISRFDGRRASVGDHGHFDGLHHRAMHRFDRFYPDYGYDLDCYDWNLLYPDTALPAYCS
jgi:hypothetical protein